MHSASDSVLHEIMVLIQLVYLQAAATCIVFCISPHLFGILCFSAPVECETEIFVSKQHPPQNLSVVELFSCVMKHSPRPNMEILLELK